MDGTQTNYTEANPQQYPDPQYIAQQYAYPDPQYTAPQYTYPDSQYAAPQYTYPDPQYGYYPEYYDAAPNGGRRIGLEITGLMLGVTSAILALIALINFFVVIHNVVEAVRDLFSVFFNFGSTLQSILAIPVLSGIAVAFAIPAFCMKAAVKRKAETHTPMINIGFGTALAGCIIGVLCLAVSIGVYIYLRQAFMNFMYFRF